MAQYFTDFSEYSVGVTPADWPAEWGSITRNTVSGNPLSSSTVSLLVDSTDASYGRTATSWGDAGTASVVATSVRLTGKFGSGTSDDGICSPIICGGGTQSTRTGYYLFVRATGNIVLRRALDGSVSSVASISTVLSDLTTDQDITIELSISASGVVEAYIWETANTKPASPNISYTDGSPLGAGWVGFADISNENHVGFDLHYFGVGTNGDPAPTSAPTGADHALDATDIQSSTQVSSPIITQVHDLAANDTESASNVTSPTITQIQSLSATSVESASQVSNPSLTESNALTANDISSATQVSSPGISQAHNLNASDVQSASSVSSPSLTQNHSLSANDLNSTSEVSSPSLASGVDHSLSAVSIESVTGVSSPVLTQAHKFQSLSISSISETGIPGLQQVHDLTGLPIESSTSVSSPSLTDSGSAVEYLTANGVTISPELSLSGISLTPELSATAWIRPALDAIKIDIKPD